jgi:hypothetical protein
MFLYDYGIHVMNEGVLLIGGYNDSVLTQQTQELISP